MTSTPVFYCINYPGLVENEQAAIKTLGGAERIEQAFQRKNGKILLNFQPENIFSKLLCSTAIDDSNSHFSTSSFARSDNCEPKSANLLTRKGGRANEADELFGVNESGSTLPNQNSDQLSMPCLLMRVNTKTRRRRSTNKIEVKESSGQILGKITKIYTFNSIADFQYLPMSSVTKTTPATNETTTTFDAFYDHLRFDKIDDHEEDLRKSIPLYVMPPFFSRFDVPVNYAYRSESNKKNNSSTILNFEKTNNSSDLSATESTSHKFPTKESKTYYDSESRDSTKADKEAEGVVSGGEESAHGEEEEMDEDENETIEKLEKTGDLELIKSRRKTRSSFAQLISFNTRPAPAGPKKDTPPPRSDHVIKCVAALKELFQQRPCYLKSVLMCLTDFSTAVLKDSLPFVSYYFTTGPWRSIWCRFGYDPREMPEAKMYQMIDYRLRYSIEAELNMQVKSKPRSSYHKRKFRNDLSESEDEDYKNIKVYADMYKFKPDKMPPSRNVYYQLCDIDDEDVQKFIGSIEKHPLKCSSKDGWCTPNFQHECRDIMSRKHETLSKQLASEHKEQSKKADLLTK